MEFPYARLRACLAKEGDAGCCHSPCGISNQPVSLKVLVSILAYPQPPSPLVINRSPWRVPFTGDQGTDLFGG